MNDLELKNLLLDSCSIRPGQEARAWAALKDRLAPTPRRTGFFLAAWRPMAYSALALLLALTIFDLGMSMRPSRHALVFADSQSPGIYATSFYSNSAQAQVVWLNGMEPASDKPTYLDPTTVVSINYHTGTPSAPPDSL
jgi:hypothetical protein